MNCLYEEENSNIELSLCRNIYSRRYIAILFRSAKNYKTKYNTLFYRKTPNKENFNK